MGRAQHRAVVMAYGNVIMKPYMLCLYICHALYALLICLPCLICLAYMSVMTHEIVQVVMAYGNVIPKPLILAKDRLVGMDLVQAEISKVRLAVEDLKDKCNVGDVAAFLGSVHNATLSKYVLSLQGVVYKMLSDNAEPCHIQVVRGAIEEATSPLFTSPASFPAALPHTAATQAIYAKTVRKGPLLHAPVPVPYVDMGHKLLTVPEDVRSQLKTEWTKLEALVVEALAAKSISASGDPLLAATATQHMLLMSRELDQMRAHLCMMHSGIKRPRSLDEYKEWIKVYEKEVVARMIKAKEKADRDYSELQATALAGDSGASAAQTRLAEKAQADYEALQSEMAQRSYMV